MAASPFVSLILPAYNEAQRIAETVQEAVNYFSSRGLEHEIIVSADGDDGTREIVQVMASANPRIKVIGDVRRRGKGYGIRQAVQLAEGRFIGYSDADNKTPIEEFDKFVKPLMEGYELVIGSRAMAESIIERRQPWFRRLGSKGFALFMHAAVGLRDISDTQCGFKFFQQSAAKMLFAQQRIDGYMFDVEILCIAKQAGYRILQLPVRWRDDADSRLLLVRGNIRNVLDILGVRFRRGWAVRGKPTEHAPIAANG